MAHDLEVKWAHNGEYTRIYTKVRINFINILNNDSPYRKLTQNIDLIKTTTWISSVSWYGVELCVTKLKEKKWQTCRAVISLAATEL
jgi:hypothetical protein